MTPEQQRIAIAEACGWTDIAINCHQVTDEPFPFGQMPDGKFYAVPPDYPGSMDAMHEAEKVLTKEQRATYVSWLQFVHPECCLSQCTGSDVKDILGEAFFVATATAAQRAEAFCQVVPCKCGCGEVIANCPRYKETT